MDLGEKISYIAGLADGLDIDTSKKEGKLLKAVVEALGDIVEEIKNISSDITDLEDLVDELDEDLGAVEEEVYGDCCDDDCDCCCCDEDDEDIDDGFEITCPSCGETIVFDGTVDDDGELVCPNCKEKIVYDTEDKE